VEVKSKPFIVFLFTLLGISLACNAPNWGPGITPVVPTLDFQTTQTAIDLTTTPVDTPTSNETTLPATATNPRSLGIGAESIAPVDGAVLVYVPAGEFVMGSDPDSDPFFWGAESPQHPIYLDAFWIYKTEVTNGMYGACVTTGACTLPQTKTSIQREAYFGEARYDPYPVIQLQWKQALAYCQWAGGSLPSEAQWEKAARGPQDARLFPWGNSTPNQHQANFCDLNCPNSGESDPTVNDGYADTAPVGSYPDGASLYGALDMSGNVWEWVADWHSVEYYGAAPYENPLGPVEGTRKGIRGGSWYNGADGVRVVTRASQKPEEHFNSVGFRCVFNLP
jgi:formylglycine-generating enzyme required for sulfatase activity